MIYFAYGSNMDESQIKVRCSDPKLIGKACLSGYRIAFDQYSPSWDSGVADVIKDENSQVWGLIYKITKEDLKKLDSYEGHPNFYNRIEVTVTDEQGLSQKVITYEVVNKESFMPPSPMYLNILKKAAEVFNFPEDYKLFFDSIKTKED